MIGHIFLLLVLNGFCESAIFFVKDHENENEELLNLKLTKLLDLKVHTKADTWKNDLNQILHSEIDENHARKLGESIQVPLKLTIAVDKNKEYPNSFNHTERCKSLLGTSKLPLCRFHEKRCAQRIFPRNCREILESGNNKSGIYEIQPRLTIKPFAVLCDMETKGGGWTHIQKRFDGSQDFYLKWRDYKFGFGDLTGEFWIGLEKIYDITGFESTELLVEVIDREKITAYAKYTSFAIGEEKEGYPLNVVKGYSGDAGDSLVGHLGTKFSTQDLDHDTDARNCAIVCKGAWWYKACYVSNLNGNFVNLPLTGEYQWQSLSWGTFRKETYALAGSRMMVRPLLV